MLQVVSDSKSALLVHTAAFIYLQIIKIHFQMFILCFVQGCIGLTFLIKKVRYTLKIKEVKQDENLKECPYPAPKEHRMPVYISMLSFWHLCAVSVPLHCSQLNSPQLLFDSSSRPLECTTYWMCSLLWVVNVADWVGWKFASQIR